MVDKIILKQTCDNCYRIDLGCDGAQETCALYFQKDCSLCKYNCHRERICENWEANYGEKGKI